MNPPKLEFVRLRPSAGVPQYMSASAAGFDLSAALEVERILAPGERGLIETGLSIAIPDGYEGQVRPRSGLALEYGVTVANAPGTIDADYRGEVKVLLVNLGNQPARIVPRQRIAQLVIAPIARVQLAEVQELTTTQRGEGGFGSTGTR